MHIQRAGDRGPIHVAVKHGHVRSDEDAIITRRDTATSGVWTAARVPGCRHGGRRLPSRRRPGGLFGGLRPPSTASPVLWTSRRSVQPPFSSCSALEETSFLSALLKKHVGTLKVDHHYHGYPLSSFLSSSRSSQYTADRRAATTTPLLEQAAFIQIPQQQGFVHFCPSTGRAHDRRSFVRLSGLGR